MIVNMKNVNQTKRGIPSIKALLAVGVSSEIFRRIKIA
jgi:hypothetical protein